MARLVPDDGGGPGGPGRRDARALRGVPQRAHVGRGRGGDLQLRRGRRGHRERRKRAADPGAADQRQLLRRGRGAAGDRRRLPGRGRVRLGRRGQHRGRAGGGDQPAGVAGLLPGRSRRHRPYAGDERQGVPGGRCDAGRLRGSDRRCGRCVGAAGPASGDGRDAGAEPLPLGDRAAPSGRDDRAGAGGAGRAFAASRRAISAGEGAARATRSAEGGHRRVIEPGARDHAGRGRAGAGPGLRQHRQPDAGARLGARARVRGALGARRGPDPAVAAVADRESHAGARGRARGPARGAPGDVRDRGPRRGHDSAPGRARARSAAARVLAGHSRSGARCCSG